MICIGNPLFTCICKWFSHKDFHLYQTFLPPCLQGILILYQKKLGERSLRSVQNHPIYVASRHLYPSPNLAQMLYWLVVYLPLWKMMEFVSWGWWNSQLFLESHSKFLGSKPPTSLPFLSLFLWFLRSTTEDEDEFYWKLIRMDSADFHPKTGYSTDGGFHSHGGIPEWMVFFMENTWKYMKVPL